jgi:hypothetical protein
MSWEPNSKSQEKPGKHCAVVREREVRLEGKGKTLGAYDFFFYFSFSSSMKCSQLIFEPSRALKICDCDLFIFLLNGPDFFIVPNCSQL